MPYINQKARKRYDPHLKKILAELEKSDFDPGHMNYTFYKILVEFFKKRTSYRSIDEIDGILSNVGREFYRRWAVLYEEKKIKENGDIK